MPSFSQKSETRLQSCHEQIQLVMREAILYVDFSVEYGYRGEAVQNKAYSLGHSTKKFPQSKHNKVPALAIDILPYPSGWPQETDSDNTRMHKLGHFYYMAGVVMKCAEDLGVRLRWGGDWNSDKNFLDQKFDDLAHFELVL